MPQNTVRKIETTMSDRDVLMHILQHVEEQGQILWDLKNELDEFRPMLDLLRRPDGKPDMLGALALRRRARRG